MHMTQALSLRSRQKLRRSVYLKLRMGRKRANQIGRPGRSVGKYPAPASVLRTWSRESHLAKPQSQTLSSPSRSDVPTRRSEEHTSELQSLMRISYAVFCLKKKNKELYHRSPS